MRSSTKNSTGVEQESRARDTAPGRGREDRALRHRQLIDTELRKWAMGFVTLRWFVPLLIFLAALLAWASGLGFNIVAVLGVGLFTLLYNVFFHVVGRKVTRWLNAENRLHLFAYAQVSLDYAAVFFLVHLTGGVASPLVFFFFFHIVFAAILLPRRSAFGFAGIASAGMVLMAVGERTHLLAHHSLSFRGDAFTVADKPWYLAILLAFFIVSIFVTALSSSLIMDLLRKRIIENVAFYEREERSAEERWRFMRKAAHNLRAPLASVMSMIEVLKEDYLGPLTPTQQEHLRRIYRRIRSMAAMIEKLMTIAKSRTGMPKPPPKPMRLSDMAGRISRTFEDSALQKHLAFSIEVPEHLSETVADLEVVEPVLENLISNAIKYTQSGRITVSVSRSDALLRFTVEDTGIGIPDNDKARLFNEFFRARNAKGIEEIGTGLGLALIKETVSQIGGRIEWESEENVGTRFDVYLPALAPGAKG